jgi:signal transduction histidine kinase
MFNSDELGVAGQSRAIHRLNFVAEQYRALQNAVTEIIAVSPDLEQATLQIIQLICLHTDWDFGEIWRIDPENHVLVHQANWWSHSAEFPKFEAVTRQITFTPGLGLPGRVWKMVQPVWIPNVVEDTGFLRAPFAAKEGLRGGVGFPLCSRENVVGVMSFFSRSVRTRDGELLALFEDLGRHIGLFIERERRQLLEREQVQRQIAVQERARLGRDLQSMMLKNLFSIAVTAEILPYLWESNQTKLWYSLGEVRQTIRQTMVESQGLLLPGAFMPESDLRVLLEPLLENLTEKTQCEVSLIVRGQYVLPMDVQVILYCIVQEALQNIIHHAYATNVRISLRTDQSGNELHISDDGKGYDPTKILPDRLGFRIMRGCAEAIAGRLEIGTAPNQGTQISLLWLNPRQE